MIVTRAAVPEDAPEIVRLRRLMFAAMRDHDESGAWEDDARELLRGQLAGRGALVGAFVVEADGGPDAAPGPAPGEAAGAAPVGGAPLAACAVGSVEQRLPAPGHPTGRFGFVFNVCADPAHRGRGYARATTEALLDWFAAQGVSRVDLHATPDAERLYRAMGFTEHPTALSMNVAARRG
ncbi:GNAT family N-acetyltransferase [Streptomyces sp. H27-D2]|uniref:GNAT family N-acetyltransferase n=1 Tax=Streptomyces sp. H27-D2 TaxID=3046304 RepID=UPI002DBB2583|nr:GNAT family N-acetyltransferase [Streptomyces sp. H27-D2]MEC4020397.1 GNAT family N-acetyltransferase [Streptomyces sp. H27-D2]